MVSKQMVCTENFVSGVYSGRASAAQNLGEKERIVVYELMNPMKTDKKEMVSKKKKIL